jgi:hypothetical protein
MCFARHYIADGRDHALAAERHNRQGELIIARKDRQPVAA